MKQRVTPKSRADWLDIRKGFTGCSKIPVLLGCDPYTTLAQFWAEKTGRLDPEPQTVQMRRGTILEAPALEMLAEERPDWTITPNPIPGGFLVIDDETQICATPDALATRPDRPGPGVIQVKSVDPFAFKKNWLDDMGGIEPPTHVLVQTLAEMHMTDAKWGTVAALVVSSGIDLHVIDIEPIPGLIETLIAKNREFWQFVEKDERPPLDYGRDGALIAQLHRGLTPDKTIDLSGDNSFRAAIADYLDAKTIISAAEKRKATAEAEIRDKLADATAATAGDFFVTAKVVNRAEHMVRATSYRQLRIKDKS
jgi:predicted phage-related endonuclease